jgi:hypothetical protein
VLLTPESISNKKNIANKWFFVTFSFFFFLDLLLVKTFGLIE